MQYTLPTLPFALGDLAPALSEEALRLHIEKHHAGYVKNLNIHVSQLQNAIETNDLTKMVTLQRNIAFHGGGHLNHCLFWENLSSSGQGTITQNGPLLAIILKTYGSFQKCVEYVTSVALGIQGAGWAWLCYCPAADMLCSVTTPNHDFPPGGLLPLVCIDMWEHAFYVQYKHDKAAYVHALWPLINWQCAERRLIDIQKQQ